MTDTVMCSYGECSQDPITTLQINDEEKPVCNNHIQALMEKHTDQEQSKPGDPPVMTQPGEDEGAAWINTDKNGNTYLSIKTNEGNYLNFYPQTSLLTDALQRQHKVTQNQ